MQTVILASPLGLYCYAAKGESELAFSESRWAEDIRVLVHF